MTAPRVRFDVRPFPSPSPKDMASLAHQTEQAAHDAAIMDRWNRRVRANVARRCQAMLGVPPLPPRNDLPAKPF